MHGLSNVLLNMVSVNSFRCSPLKYNIFEHIVWLIEMIVCNADTVLLDMCDIVDRDVPTDPPHVRKWFRNVFEDGVGSLGTCSNEDEEYMPRVTECVRADGTPESGNNPESSSTSLRIGVGLLFSFWFLLGCFV